jgi:deoxycytidylate deaminase
MNTAKYMRLLFSIAEDVVPVSNARFAAAVIYKNRVISIGTNQYKTHPFASKYAKNPSAIFLHAEADAILKATKRIGQKEMSKSMLVVVRVKYDRAGNPMFGLSRPCVGCVECIKDHGIKTVAYTNNAPLQELQYTVCDNS